jgi:beta-aspartyl-peptidase (threonine type)
MAQPFRPALIVHGGAGNWTNFDESAVLNGVRAAALAGWDILQAGGSAIEAVEGAAILLEDDPLFDAGYGSFVNLEGEVEMDALITDGRDIRFGAVAAVRRVRHAITLARLVMTRTENCFFAGDGADQLAAEFGLPLIPNIDLVTEKEFALFRQREADRLPRAGLGTGTIGAAAVDSAGHVASATSTGGTPDKRKGRVGDSPIFGAGGYADDAYGAASATGRGEQIMRFFLCKEAVDALHGISTAQAAAQAAMQSFTARVPSPEAGLILVGVDGSLGAVHTTPAMPTAWVTASGQVGAVMQVPLDFGI